MLIRRTLPLLLLSLLGGLAVAEGEHWTVNGIRPGLHQAEVVEILGPPQAEEDSLDSDGQKKHTLEYPGIRIALKQDSVYEITGSSLELDGRIVAQQGFRRSDSLKALGEPLSSAPELNTGSHFSRGQDVYAGEPTSVRVNYWQGQVENIHFCEKCGLSATVLPNERRWKVASMARTVAENRQDFPAVREQLKEMLAAARESGPSSTLMADTLMQFIGPGHSTMAPLRTVPQRQAPARLNC